MGGTRSGCSVATCLVAVCCPAGFVQEPGDLRRLAAAGLTDNHHRGMVFYQVQQLPPDLLSWQLVGAGPLVPVLVLSIWAWRWCCCCCRSVWLSAGIVVDAKGRL